MKQESLYPEVNDSLLGEIVRRICEVGRPYKIVLYKIVLFGSRARGDARPDSDLDFLIVEDSILPRHQRATQYRRALLGLFPAKDIVVWTAEEIQEWSEVPNAFINATLREGKVLYEG